MTISQTPTLMVTPHHPARAIDSPGGPRACVPYRYDRASRKGFDGYLVANSIGGAS